MRRRNGEDRHLQRQLHPQAPAARARLASAPQAGRAVPAGDQGAGLGLSLAGARLNRLPRHVPRREVLQRRRRAEPHRAGSRLVRAGRWRQPRRGAAHPGRRPGDSNHQHLRPPGLRARLAEVRLQAELVQAVAHVLPEASLAKQAGDLVRGHERGADADRRAQPGETPQARLLSRRRAQGLPGGGLLGLRGRLPQALSRPPAIHLLGLPQAELAGRQ